MWFVFFFFLLWHLKSSVFYCVGMRTRKENMIWPTISKSQFSLHVVICFFDMTLVSHTPVWHPPWRVSGCYSANFSLNAKYFISGILDLYFSLFVMIYDLFARAQLLFLRHQFQSWQPWSRWIGQGWEECEGLTPHPRKGGDITVISCARKAEETMEELPGRLIMGRE